MEIEWNIVIIMMPTEQITLLLLSLCSIKSLLD